MESEKNNPLVGTWHLVSFEMRFADGTKIFPWGSRVLGQVIYTADGFMSGTFMKEGRPRFASNDIAIGTPAEYEQAMTTFISYCGTYDYVPPQVIHHAKVSLFPNWIDTDIEREVVLEGNRLTLSTPPLPFGGQLGTASLVWQKASR
jgi:hypothetical protein